MNCRKANKLIFLFAELSSEEKTNLEKHLQQCEACSKLFADVQKQQEALQAAQTWHPEIKDPVAFTDQIMNALPTSREEKKKKTFFRWMPDWSLLQTALATCSLLLMFTFAVEFNAPGNVVQHQQPVKNGVTLSSNSEALIQAKRSRTERFSLEKVIHQYNTIALSNQ